VLLAEIFALIFLDNTIAISAGVLQMRQFWSIVLAVAIGFSGAMISSHISHSSNLQTPASTTEKASFLIVEAEESNAVEVDGIRFENIIEGRIFPISEEGSEDYTPVKISLKITNNSSTLQQFTRFDNLYLDMINSAGKTISGGVLRNYSTGPFLSDLLSVQPRESIVFSIDFKMMWWYGDLKLRAEEGFGGMFTYANIKPDRYQVSLGYLYNPHPSSSRTDEFYDPETDTSILAEALWVGSANPKPTLIQIVSH
jgi:hypothetical protein